MIEDLRNKVYHKINSEYLEYIDNIKQLSLEDIIKNSYQIAIKEEFIDMFSVTGNYNKFQLLALLEKENTLDYLYEAYEGTDGGLHNFLEEKLDEEFYNLGNDYVEKINEKIELDSNSELVKDISEALTKLDRYEFCNYIKKKFNVEDLDVLDVYNILNKKDGAKYLYDFCNQVKDDQQLLYLKEIMIIDSEAIDRIEDKILPKLKTIIDSQEKNSDTKTKDKGREDR